MSAADVFKMIKENDVKFVDLRFTDTKGKEQHVTVPTKMFGEDKFTDGHAFDGSSIAGWKGIEASDMLLMPDPTTAYIDPFMDETTLNISCDVVEPSDGKGYERDPRSLARRAEAYLKSSGIGDVAYFGPEPEFYIFDDIRLDQNQHSGFYRIKPEVETLDLAVIGAEWGEGRRAQHFGSYQAIYGSRWVTRPFDGDTPVTPSLIPKWQDYQPLGGSDMRTVMTNAKNSFLEFMSWDYSVYFPNSGNDPTRLQKYNALLIDLPADYRDSDGQTIRSAAHSATVRDFMINEYEINHRTDATYNAFRPPYHGRMLRRMSDGAVVSVEELATNPRAQSLFRTVREALA